MNSYAAPRTRLCPALSGEIWDEFPERATGDKIARAVAQITVLHQAAEKAPVADARTEILKAIAVLRDGVGR